MLKRNGFSVNTPSIHSIERSNKLNDRMHLIRQKIIQVGTVHTIDCKKIVVALVDSLFHILADSLNHHYLLPKLSESSTNRSSALVLSRMKPYFY